MEAGDVAWVLVSAALVLFMTPGLALFYGGMDRSRNVLNMLMMNFWCLLIVPVVIILVAENLGHIKAVTAMTGKNLDVYMGRAVGGDGDAEVVAGVNRRRTGTQAQVAGNGIHEQRIGDPRMRVLSLGAPFVPGPIGELEVPVFRVPIQIVVEPVVAARPIAAQQRAFVEINDIVFKRER